jgi:hypothetical protein
MRERSGVFPAVVGASAMIAAGLLSMLVARPGTGHWMIPRGIAASLISAGNVTMWPALIAGIFGILICTLAYTGQLTLGRARSMCWLIVAASLVLTAPIGLLIVQAVVMLIVAILIGIAVIALCGVLLVGLAAG